MREHGLDQRLAEPAQSLLVVAVSISLALPHVQILDRADPTNTNVYVGNLATHLTGEALEADPM